MSGRTWLIPGIVASLLTGSGCVTAGQKGYALARDAGPICDVPLTQRNQVYVFVVGGNRPASAAALDRFREGINATGFAKVVSGQPLNAGWMATEMRRIHSEDANAVFVLIGTGAGGPIAAKMAEKGVVDGLPIQALAFIDSVGLAPIPMLGVRLLTLGNGHGAIEPVMGTDAGRGVVIGDQRTVLEVAELLNELALGTAPPPPPTVSESSYEFAPPVREAILPEPNSEWSFLFDQPGGMTRGINDPLPARTPTTTNTTAGK